MKSTNYDEMDAFCEFGVWQFKATNYKRSGRQEPYPSLIMLLKRFNLQYQTSNIFYWTSYDFKCKTFLNCSPHSPQSNSSRDRDWRPCSSGLSRLRRLAASDRARSFRCKPRILEQIKVAASHHARKMTYEKSWKYRGHSVCIYPSN